MKNFWSISFYCFVKPVTRLLEWVVRKEEDNYSLFSLGEMLCDYCEEHAGNPCIKSKHIDWLMNHGLKCLDDAVHGEADKIKKLYELDENMDIDDVDEEIIYEYFGERMG